METILDKNLPIASLGLLENYSDYYDSIHSNISYSNEDENSDKSIENLKAKIESKHKYAIFTKKSIFVQKRKKQQFKTQIGELKMKRYKEEMKMKEARKSYDLQARNLKEIDELLEIENKLKNKLETQQELHINREIEREIELKKLKDRIAKFQTDFLYPQKHNLNRKVEEIICTSEDMATTLYIINSNLGLIKKYKYDKLRLENELIQIHDKISNLKNKIGHKTMAISNIHVKHEEELLTKKNEHNLIMVGFQNEFNGYCCDHEDAIFLKKKKCKKLKAETERLQKILRTLKQKIDEMNSTFYTKLQQNETETENYFSLENLLTVTQTSLLNKKINVSAISFQKNEQEIALGTKTQRELECEIQFLKQYYIDMVKIGKKEILKISSHALKLKQKLKNQKDMLKNMKKEEKIVMKNLKDIQIVNKNLSSIYEKSYAKLGECVIPLNENLTFQILQQNLIVAQYAKEELQKIHYKSVKKSEKEFSYLQETIRKQEANLEKIHQKIIISKAQMNPLFNEINLLINEMDFPIINKMNKSKNSKTNINNFDSDLVSNYGRLDKFLGFAQIAAHILDEETLMNFYHQHGFNIEPIFLKNQLKDFRSEQILGVKCSDVRPM